MEYGKISGLDKPISRIVFGTAIRTMMAGNDADDLLDAAVEAGINAFDTARGYALAERSLGHWLAHRGNRNQLVLITKGCNVGPLGGNRVNRKTILSEMDRSLETLQTDHVDLYLLHRDNPDMAAGEILEILNELKQAGKITCIGVSNWTHQRIQEANEYAAAHGLAPIVASSPHYGLPDQFEDPWGGGCISLSGPDQGAARSWYREHVMPVFAYASLGCGFFSGKFKAGDEAEAKKILTGGLRKSYLRPEIMERLRRAEILAEELHATVSEIALAWVLRQDLDVYALVGASSPARIQSNCKALEIPLSETQCQWLDLQRDEP